MRTNATEQNGFTLIEVLFVFAIASIISIISFPYYQNYAIRTKVSGDIPIMHPLMMNMNVAYGLNAEWPATNAEAGAKEPGYYKGKYLMSAQVSDNPQAGTMTLTYDAEEIPILRGTDTLVFYPDDVAGGDNWKCDQGTIPLKYRPTNCR